MGRYAQARKRGRGVPVLADTLPAVPLTIVADTVLDWSGYEGADPSTWIVTLNGVFAAAADGAERSFPPDPLLPGEYRVQGVNDDPSPVTQLSNAVSFF